ncbi:MAG: hypothetical protein AAGI03_01775 [Pseudomonadota bacterium]
MPKAAHMISRRNLFLCGSSSLLIGCGGRRNRSGGGWFGWGREITTLEPEGGYTSAFADPRPLAPTIDQVTIEPTTTGVIVHASAVMPSQQYWDADLIPALGENPQNGEYKLDFRAWHPYDRTTASIGPSQAREVTAAAFLSTGDLDEVRRITVIAANGSISRSR